MGMAPNPSKEMAQYLLKDNKTNASRWEAVNVDLIDSCLKCFH